MIEIPIYSGRAIYGIHNTSNNKWYIGSSCRLNERLQTHFSLLKSGKHKNVDMQTDFDNGDKFRIVILSKLPSGVSGKYDYILLEVEKEYIRKYDSVRNGYNRSIPHEWTDNKKTNWHTEMYNIKPADIMEYVEDKEEQ